MVLYFPLLKMKKRILQDVPHECRQIVTLMLFMFLLNLLMVGLHIHPQITSLIASKAPDVSLNHSHVNWTIPGKYNPGGMRNYQICTWNSCHVGLWLIRYDDKIWCCIQMFLHYNQAAQHSMSNEDTGHIIITSLPVACIMINVCTVFILMLPQICP